MGSHVLQNMMACSVYYFLVLLLYIFTSCSISLAGLYNSNDCIVLVNNYTLEKVVFNSRNAWLVEFYSSSCGHCVNFAPIFKNFAKDIYEWRDVMGVAAIDCAEEGNMDICKKYDIRGFPTIKFFNASADIHLGKEMEGLSIEKLREDAVNYLDINHSSNRPINWPSFEPVQFYFVKNFFIKNKDVKYLSLIFEDKHSFVGRELILDMYKFDAMVVRRVLKSSASLVLDYQVKMFPALIVIESNGFYRKLGRFSNRTRESFRESLLTLPELVAPEHKLPTRLPKSEDLNQSALAGNLYLPLGSGVYMSDLESTLLFSFRQEIPMKKIIAGESLDALKSFVQILVKYFPARKGILHYLEELQFWLEDNSTRDKISSDQWLQYVNERYDPEKVHYSQLEVSNSADTFQEADSYLPQEVNWKGCMGSVAHYRRYPCGLWTLFHTLTVQAAASHQQDPSWDSREVLFAMKDYIKTFFTCVQCRDHFAQMTPSIVSVASPDQSILWLWRVHNQVNQRLKGQNSEDPQFPKLPFPPPQLCKDCILPNSVREWKKREVLKFLKSYYGANNIKRDQESFGIRRSHAPNKNPKVKEKQGGEYFRIATRKKETKKTNNKRVLEPLKSQNLTLSFMGLGSMDVSLCLSLYLLCTVLFIFLYFFFCRKRKYKLPKHLV